MHGVAIRVRFELNAMSIIGDNVEQMVRS